MSDMEGLKPRTEVAKTRKGEVTIHEFAVDDIDSLTGELLALFADFKEEDWKGGNAALLLKLLRQKRISGALKKILAIVSDKDELFFATLSIIDLLRVIRAFLRVNPIGEVKDLFFEIRGMLVDGVPTK